MLPGVDRSMVVDNEWGPEQGDLDGSYCKLGRQSAWLLPLGYSYICSGCSQVWLGFGPNPGPLLTLPRND